MNTPSKVILITGASSGIGLATAKHFARNGAKLILLARRTKRLAAIKEMLEKEYQTQTQTFTCDVSDLTAVQSTVAQNLRLFETVDILVNCAGLAVGWGPFYKAKPEDWNRVIDTNHKGILFMIRAIVPLMLKKNSGHVINLGSVAGRWVYPNDAIYCATKFAVRSISDSLRIDLFNTNIRVTNIEPGPVKTEIADIRHQSPEAASRAWQGYEPMIPEDIAESIYWTTIQPDRVNIQEIVLFPTCQASVFQLDRK